MYVFGFKYLNIQKFMFLKACMDFINMLIALKDNKEYFIRIQNIFIV